MVIGSARDSFRSRNIGQQNDVTVTCLNTYAVLLSARGKEPATTKACSINWGSILELISALLLILPACQFLQRAMFGSISWRCSTTVIRLAASFRTPAAQPEN